MISYFKYTDGSAFTLDGVDYRGMVTVVDKVAYPGTIYTSTSKPLSSKGTFMSNTILNKLEFDYTISSNLLSAIKLVEVYPKGIFDVISIKETLQTLNNNNLKIFAAGVGYNQHYNNTLFTDKNNSVFVTAVSSLSSGLISRRDTETALNLKFASTSPGTTSPILDRSSIFTTLSTSFKYFTKNEIIQGEINTSTPPTISRSRLGGLVDGRSHIKYDKYKDVIYQSQASTFTTYSYDANSPYNSAFVRDVLDLSQFATVPHLHKTTYGKNYRVVISRNQGKAAVEIYSVASAELLKTYSLKQLGIGSVRYIAQRFEDDALVLVGNANFTTELRVYDIGKLVNSITTPIVTQSLNTSKLPSFIEFSPFDSNIMIFSYYLENALDFVEFRPISGGSNSPITVITSDQFSLFVTGNIFSAIEDLINTSNATMYDATVNVYDVQFDVDETVNSIVFANNHIKTNNTNIFDTIVPFSTLSKYSDIEISDSSIGLVLNSAFKAVVYDTLTLHYLFNTVKFIDDSAIYEQTTAEVRDISTTDLLIYSNESINIGTMNRTIKEILNLQLNLAGKIDSAR